VGGWRAVRQVMDNIHPDKKTPAPMHKRFFAGAASV
jgi:hypothetical protein